MKTDFVIETTNHRTRAALQRYYMHLGYLPRAFLRRHGHTLAPKAKAHVIAFSLEYDAMSGRYAAKATVRVLERKR